MSIYSFMALLNKTYRQKRSLCIISFRAGWLKYIYYCQTHQLIVHYRISRNKIYLYVNMCLMQPLMRWYIRLSTTQTPIFINFKQLERLMVYYSTNLLILSTPTGLQNHLMLLEQRRGGMLLFLVG